MHFDQNGWSDFWIALTMTFYEYDCGGRKVVRESCNLHNTLPHIVDLKLYRAFIRISGTQSTSSVEKYDYTIITYVQLSLPQSKGQFQIQWKH